MDAELSTTSRQSSCDAVPPQPCAMRRAARMPSGVAALPSPSRSAERLAEIAASVSGSRLASGSSRRSSGRNSRASAAESPHCSMTSITPVQRHMMPAIDTHSSTAAVAPSSAAPPSSPTLPVSMPNTSETATIPVQSHAIAIKIPPPEAGFGLFYARAAGKYALRAEQPKFLSDFLKKIQKDA